MLKTNNYGCIDGKIQKLKLFKEKNNCEAMVIKLNRIIQNEQRCFLGLLKKNQANYIYYTNKASNLFTNINKTLKRTLST